MVIADGDTVIFECNGGKKFFLQVKATSKVKLGKVLHDLTPVIGAPYGSVFEGGLDGKLKIVPEGTLFTDSLIEETTENEENEKDNRNIVDTNTAQTLDDKDIQAFRERGTEGKDIIKHLVSNSQTYATKTEFSKQKYLKRKQIKYTPRVRLLQVTARRLCEVYFDKGPIKIGYLRHDSLAQMLMYSNIYAGAQVLVVENCMGLLTGAVAERMGGYGRILAGYDGQQAGHDVLQRFNFSDNVRKSIIPYPFYYLKQLQQSEESLIATVPVLTAAEQQERQALIEKRAAERTPEQTAAYEANRLMQQKKKRRKTPPSVVRGYLRQPSDALLIASDFNPTLMLSQMLPLLGDSKPFVVFFKYLEPLTELFNSLQETGQAINLQLTATWTREYQVLPSRTHPTMSMNSCGGYLLTGTKVSGPNVVPRTRELFAKKPRH